MSQDSYPGKRISHPVVVAMAVAAVGTGSLYSSGTSAGAVDTNNGQLDRDNYQRFATLSEHLESGAVLEATIDDGDDEDSSGEDTVPSERTSFTEYTVQPDDELKHIAASFGLRTSTLVWANDLADPDLIYPGDVLVIPPTDGISVQVEQGDTLRGIATEYGVSMTAIINYEPNGISDPDMISTGQTLIVPGGMPPVPDEPAPSPEPEGTSSDGGDQTAEYQEAEPEPEPEGIYVDVQAGDTILGLAERYGVSSSAIIDWGPNGLSNPDALSIGQTLFIPGGVEPAPEEEATAEFQQGGETEIVDTEPPPEPDTSEPPPEQEPDPEVEVQPEPEPEPEPEPSSNAGAANGNFVWPTEGVITQRFGHTSFSQSSGWYGSTGHTGLDIAARAQTPIYAADGGTVIVSGWSGGYGNAVAIDHGNGYVTWYAHMASQPPVSVGQKVAQGEYIGPVGSTGYSTGAHLHFEIRKNGNYQDPLQYLR